jgi:hypothetical protein
VSILAPHVWSTSPIKSQPRRPPSSTKSSHEFSPPAVDIVSSKRGYLSSLVLSYTTLQPEDRRGVPPPVALEQWSALTQPHIDAFPSSVNYPVRTPLPSSPFWTPRDPTPLAVDQVGWSSGELESGGREMPLSTLFAPPPLLNLISAFHLRPDG